MSDTCTALQLMAVPVQLSTTELDCNSGERVEITADRVMMQV